MDIVEIIRLESSPRGTLGSLRLNKTLFCITLELPWMFNQQNVSSIPVGSYDCERYRSERFGWTFKVLNVPGRTGILFHAGNTIADTMGCILLGETPFKLKQYERAAKNSGLTFRRFLNRVKNSRKFRLIITENY